VSNYKFSTITHALTQFDLDEYSTAGTVYPAAKVAGTRGGLAPEAGAGVLQVTPSPVTPSAKAQVRGANASASVAIDEACTARNFSRAVSRARAAVACASRKRHVSASHAGSKVGTASPSITHTPGTSQTRGAFAAARPSFTPRAAAPFPAAARVHPPSHSLTPRGHAAAAVVQASAASVAKLARCGCRQPLH
jgi:hypothetical protein